MTTNLDISHKAKVKKVESYRWVVWSILALVYVFVAFHRMGLGVVMPDLMKSFDIGAAEFANISSMYFYAYFLMQIPAGILADKIGPKKTVTIFSVLAAAGSVLFGFAPSVGVAMAARFIVGIGVSVVFVCLLKIQSRWFYAKNFALMVGMAGLGANAGALLAQTPLVYAVAAFGWRNTFIFMGVAMLFFAALALLFVKDDPKEMGLPGMDELEGRPAAPSTIKVGEALKSVLSNPRTWIASLVFIGLYVGYIILMGTYGVTFIMAFYALEKAAAANLVMSSVLGSTVGALIIGGLSDKIKLRKMPLILMSAVTLLGWILFVYVKLPVAILAVFLFIMGFTMTSFVLTWTVSNECNDRRYGGIATGVVNTFGFGFTAILPMFMGKILDAGSIEKVVDGATVKSFPVAAYQQALQIVVVLVAIAFVASLFIKETKAQNVYESK